MPPWSPPNGTTDNAWVSQPAGPSAGWTARYPDLAGKAVVLAGTDGLVLGQLSTLLAGCRVAVAVVSPSRETVDAVVQECERHDLQGYGAVGDPTDSALWQRVLPHVEQRLGPIDGVVVEGEAVAGPLVGLVSPDMRRRGRGVIVMVGRQVDVPSSGDLPRLRWVMGGSDPVAVAAAATFCLSDVLPAATATVQLSG